MAGDEGKTWQSPPSFNGQNYDIWAKKMKTICMANDLWEFVINGFNDISDPAQYAALTNAQKTHLKESRRKDAKALSLIEAAMAETIFPKIAAANYAKEAWDILKTNFQGTDKVRVVKLQNIRREFENLQMKENESIADFSSRTSNVINQLKVNGEDYQEQRIVEKILRSLPHKYDNLVMTIEEAKDLTTLIMDELMGTLQTHEHRINRSVSSSSQDQAFKAQSNPRGRGRGRNGSGRNSRGRGRGNGGQRNAAAESSGREDGASSSQNTSRGGKKNYNLDKRNIECYYCHKFGHYASECWKKQSDQSGQANVANTNVGNLNNPTAFIMCNIGEEGSPEVWYLDSGCSNHMSGNEGLFSLIDKSFKSEIRMGNNGTIPVVGKGSILVRTKQGEKREIQNVYFAPGMKHNLMSIGQLMQNGYKVHMENDMCVIHEKDGSKNILAAVQMTKNRMFPLRIETCFSSQVVAASPKQSALRSVIEDPSRLWHLRYGHLGYAGLNLLKNKKMVEGLPSIANTCDKCEACILGKQHRLPFNFGNSRRARSPLELVHTDLVGPMQTTSIGGSTYFMTFIDDFSRRTWVYFLKSKSEAFNKFVEFKAQAEKECGHYIKVLRSDRGGEYTSNVFVNFCRKNGIKKELTASYTPQQNGVAERKNRTIVEMARSMMKEKSLPTEFWGEAVATAVYLINRCPTKAVRDKIPLVAWSHGRWTVEHLRVFGCVAYAHVPKEQRQKLDDKGVKCIFTGYSSESKAYRLYDPINKKIIISRDVEFLENQSWYRQTDESPSTSCKVPIMGEEDADEQQEEGVSRRKGKQVQTLPSSSRHDRVSMPSTSEDRASRQCSSNNTEESDPTLSSLLPRKTKSLREIYQDERYEDEFEESVNFALFSHSDPMYFEEAIKEKKWCEAMNEEIDAIERNETWELTDLPSKKQVIGVKWVYKTKCNAEGEIDRHKARLVVKGYKQQYGRDYDETYAPVARMETVRAVIAIAAQHKWKVFQMDVKSAFLNGVLKEEVYVEQPPGYEVAGEENKVYRLKRALYGLKQAPRAWYSRIDSYLMSNGFSKSDGEPTLYIKAENKNVLIVVLYVDDLIFTGNDNALIVEFKEAMKSEFEMTDLGLLKFFLGIEVKQMQAGIFISQEKYANQILERFKMQNSKAAPTPTALGLKLSKEDSSKRVDPTLYKSMVGSLMYLTATRPDMMYAVSLISRFMESPRDSHWQAGKRILRYVKGTKGFGILYTASDEFELVGYTDSDWAGSIDDRKSTSGYVFHMGSGVISWASKKQPIVAQSTAEAEYIAANAAACQAIWLKRILTDLCERQEDGTTIFCDNISSIALSKNPVFHGRSKHIEIRYHFIRELVENGDIKMEFCRSEQQLADIFTKPLGIASFVHLRDCLGIMGLDQCDPCSWVSGQRGSVGKRSPATNQTEQH